MIYVEVVDVDNPESGLWQVVTKAYGRVEPGNSPDGKPKKSCPYKIFKDYIR
jgi:hypothetical protein